MGFAVASFGLLGLGILYFFFSGNLIFFILPLLALGQVLLPFLHVLVVVFIPNQPMLVLIWLEKLKQVFLKMTLVIRQLLLITLVTVLVILQAWVLIFMNHMLVQWFQQHIGYSAQVRHLNMCISH